MRILTDQRRWLTTAACVITACFIFYIVNHPAIIGATALQRQLPIYSVEREYKTIALSFDAAWGNEDTERLIEILDQYHIKTTFFVVGDWVERYPDSVAALHRAGHEIMNHSDRHAHMNPLTRKEIMADLAACNDKIEAITGQRPTLFRPPYGEYDDHVIEAARAMGLEAVQWSVDSLDWKELPAEKIIERVTTQIEPGSIVLFHNAAIHTPEALPDLIESLLRMGYEIIPVSQLLLPQPYTIDHTGRQLPDRSAAATAQAGCDSPKCRCPEDTCDCTDCLAH